MLLGQFTGQLSHRCHIPVHPQQRQRLTIGIALDVRATAQMPHRSIGLNNSKLAVQVASAFQRIFHETLGRMQVIRMYECHPVVHCQLHFLRLHAIQLVHLWRPVNATTGNIPFPHPYLAALAGDGDAIMCVFQCQALMHDIVDILNRHRANDKACLHASQLRRLS